VGSVVPDRWCDARGPSSDGDVPHQYEDKYAAAEFLTNTTLAAVFNVLATVGLPSPACAAGLSLQPDAVQILT